MTHGVPGSAEQVRDDNLSAPTQYRVLYLHIISEKPLSSEYPDRHHKNPADIQRDYISYQAHRCQ